MKDLNLNDVPDWADYIFFIEGVAYCADEHGFCAVGSTWGPVEWSGGQDNFWRSRPDTVFLPRQLEND